jgi:Spy/CpxP family protein refolding chaperone
VTTLSKRKLGLYLLALFLAGGGSGALVSWQICRRTPVAPLPPSEIGTRLRARFQSRLDLTPEQAQKMNPIIDQALGRSEAIRRQPADEIFANVSNMDQQVLLVLTPEQKVKFEEFERERRAYLRQKFGPSSHAP